MRNTAGLIALLVGLLALAVGPTAAQEAASSPAADTPVMVGDTEVRWTGAWQYDPASSVAGEQVTLSAFDPATGGLKLAMYEEVSGATVASAEDALDRFTEALLEEVSVEAVEQVDSGALDTGGAWGFYTFELQGLSLALLITVSETGGGEGAYTVSSLATTLTGDPADLAATITETQEEILLDGEPTFLAGIDVAEITGVPVASPVASPEATPGV